MTTFLSYLSIAMLAFGMFFVLTGSVGMLKMNDFWLRVHVVGLIDSPGIVLTLGGIVFSLGFGTDAFKLVLLIVLLLITGPVTIHMLCQALRHQESKKEQN